MAAAASHLPSALKAQPPSSCLPAADQLCSSFQFATSHTSPPWVPWQASRVPSPSNATHNGVPPENGGGASAPPGSASQTWTAPAAKELVAMCLPPGPYASQKSPC